MKKNIAIMVLIILTVSSLYYAFLQKTKAEKYEKLILQSENEMRKQEAIADAMKKIADQNAKLASTLKNEAVKEKILQLQKMK